MDREVGQIEDFLRHYDRPDIGLYFCTGTLRIGSNGRRKDTIQTATGLFADIDYKDHELSPAEIVRHLNHALLLPSLVIESGGGLHAYWLFREGETATKEAVTRIEIALRRLAEHVGGDPSVAEISRVMRIPGTTNYKRKQPAPVRVLKDRPAARYELEELEEWLGEARRPLLTRRDKVGNDRAGTDAPFARYVAGVSLPTDVGGRLATMQFEGAGDTSIHRTQLQVTAALLKRGETIDNVVSRVLEATRTVGDPAWNWDKEERKIRHLCEGWLRKHPQQTTTDKPSKKTAPRVIRFYDQVLADQELPPSAFKVAYLVGQLGWKTDAWASETTIARRVGLHPDTVGDLIHRLADRGHLQITTTGRGRGRTSRYRPIIKQGP
jgi:hypothetical protein